MDFFDLPERTKVGRVVPKNSFDQFTNTNQKKLFSDFILRITWTNKLSTDTVNLESKNIKEIQVFKIELKSKDPIHKIINIIDKYIPYNIVFWIEFETEAYISTASKHSHPNNDNTSVIDWIFTTEWFDKNENIYHLNLKSSLDDVFKDICIQISGKTILEGKSMDTILKIQQEIHGLKLEISRLKSAITKTKQFNKKVELNTKLKILENKLLGLE